MKIGVLGINYKSAPLHLREKIAQACHQYLGPHKVVLSTCGRTEIYMSQEDLASAQSGIFTMLKKQIPNHEHVLYTYFGPECFFHLACVTAGLDSAILAESDIQGQVKRAYEETRKKQSLPPILHYAFQKSLKLGKWVRSSYSIFQTSFRLEGLVYHLIEKTLGDSASLLFIGHSDINRKIIHYFWRKGIRKMTLCTKNLHAAHSFGLDYELTVKDRNELDHWSDYEGVIAATASSEYLITKTPEKCRTRLILDLSVPRSVDPMLVRSPDLILLDMEKIGYFFEQDHVDSLLEVETIRAALRGAVEKYIALYEKKNLVTF